MRNHRRAYMVGLIATIVAVVGLLVPGRASAWQPGDPTITIIGTVEGYSPMASGHPGEQACIANIETYNGSLYTVMGLGPVGGSYCDTLKYAGRYQTVVVQANAQSYFVAPDYWLVLPVIVRVDYQ